MTRYGYTEWHLEMEDNDEDYEDGPELETDDDEYDPDKSA